MFEPSGRGRRAEVDYCLDCHREGLTRATDPPAGEREYGVYCKAHQYSRNKESRNKKPKGTALKDYIHGRWANITERDRERLAKMCESRVAELKVLGLNDGWRRAKAFEFACVELALRKGGHLTETEEDRVITAAKGSRTGESKIFPGSIAGDPVGNPDIAQLLPDPIVRAAFRAQELGGPTTIGEPTFTDYYRQHFGKEPPEHLSEAKTDEEVFVWTKDEHDKPIQVKVGALADYEEAVRLRKLVVPPMPRFVERPEATEARREAGFVGLDEEGE
jgi:hypothetical protein